MSIGLGETWQVKLYYFLFFLATAAIQPYLNLQFRKAGLSAAEIGVISAFRPWLAAIGGYLLPMLADLFSSHKLTFILSFVICTLARALLAVPAYMQLPDPFWHIMSAILVSDTLFSPCMVLADSAVVNHLPCSSLYGRIRMWGTAGWGVMALGGGWIISAYGVWIGWVIHWVSSVLTFANAIISIPFQKPVSLRDDNDGSAAAPLLVEHDEEECDEAERPSLMRTVLHPQCFLFLLLVFVMGTGYGVIDSYLFLYLEEIGASEALMGTALTSTSLSEAPIMYFTGAIVRVLGDEGSLLLCVCAYILRLMLYTFVGSWPTPWLVLFVELLHGLTFGLTWAAGTHKAAKLAPSGMMSSMQGLFAAVFMGVGRGSGGLIGGLVYESFGAITMFRSAATWIAAGWALTTSIRLLVERKNVAADRLMSPSSPA